MEALELINTPLYNDSSLIGLWRLDGNNIDSKGGLSCIDYNVSYSTAKFGQGAVFNGSSSKIDVANSTIYDTQRITISAWVYSTNFNQNGFIFEKGSVNTQYALFFESNYINFRTMYSGWNNNWTNVSTTCLNSSNGIINNAWNHIVATYDGLYKKIYVNGKLVYVINWSQTINTGNSGERIGAYGGTAPNYWFNGSIDDLAVFNRALNYKEILGLYEGTLVKYSKNTLSKYRKDRFVGYREKTLRLEDNPLFNDPNLIGYWKLDGNSLDSKASNNGIDTAVTYPEENSHWGKPAYFNGTNSYITVGDQAINSNDFTLSCWIKRMSNVTNDYVFGKGINNTTDNSLHIGFRSTHELTLAFYGDDLNTPNMYSEINSWHLITFTYNYSTKNKKIYYDGILVASNIGIGNPSWGNNQLYIGYSPFSSTTFFHGYITDVSVFNRVLTDFEIYKLRFGFKEQNNLKNYKRLENNEVNPEIEDSELILPTDISGCKTWIDISKLTSLSDGSAISYAPDLSGNGNNLTQISAGQNPIYKTNVLNGLATMRGTVAASTTFLVPWTYSSPVSIFYIGRQTSSNGRVLSGRNNNWLMGYHGGYKDRAYYEGWLDEAVNRKITDNNWYVWTGICNTTSYLMENGKVVKYGTSGTTSPAGMCIGYTGVSEFSDFDIGEIIGYNRDLSPRERELVSNYLLKKWGLYYNVALGKPISCSPAINYWASNNPWNVTDGSTWTDNWFGIDGLSSVTVDLLKIYQVNRVDLFHYWWDGRAYYYNKVETSPDGIVWTTRFDSEVNGRYTETYEGKTINFTSSPIRYVKNILNGSSSNTGSHWVEIRVMGI